MSETAIRTPQPPLQRTRRQTKLVRSLLDLDSVFATDTAIYFALDASASMRIDDGDTGDIIEDRPEDTRWYAQITGVINLLRTIKAQIASGATSAPLVNESGSDFLATESGETFLTEQDVAARQHSLSINFFPNREEEFPELAPRSTQGRAAAFQPFERFDLSASDFDDAIAHLEAMLAPDASDFAYPTPYDQGVEAAPSFFDNASQSERVVFFFADGSALPASTAQDAADILEPYGPDVYYYRFLTSSGAGNVIDNTPDDGLPVLGSLDALSWGVWNAVLTPPSYIVPGQRGEPDESRTTSNVVMQVRIANVSATAQTASLRYRDTAADNAFHVYRKELSPDEQVTVPIAGDIIGDGVVLEARASLGGELRVTVDYVEILQEVVA